MQVCLHAIKQTRMNSIQLKLSRIFPYKKMIKRYSPLTCRLYYITFKGTPVLSAKKCLCVNSLPEVLLIHNAVHGASLKNDHDGGGRCTRSDFTAGKRCQSFNGEHFAAVFTSLSVCCWLCVGGSL